MHYEGKPKKEETSFGPLMQSTTGDPTVHPTQLKSDLRSSVPILGLKFCHKMDSAVVLYNETIRNLKSVAERRTEDAYRVL
jgi:hypothetical protein